MVPQVSDEHARGISRGTFDPDEWMPLVHEAVATDIQAPEMECYDDYDANRP